MKSAIKQLQTKVLNGELGEEAQAEYKKFMLENTPQWIWRNKIIGKQLLADGVNKGIMINITSITSLAKASIKSGKIDGITLRSIINSLLELDVKSKIRYESSNQNDKNIEAAVELVKLKALAGELGEEAQSEMKIIIAQENIQNEITEVIQEI